MNCINLEKTGKEPEKRFPGAVPSSRPDRSSSLLSFGFGTPWRWLAGGIVTADRPAFAPLAKRSRIGNRNHDLALTPNG